MKQTRKFSKVFLLIALVTFAISVALSWGYNASAFQFVDRIVRPCGGTSTGIVQVTTTNILINPCPGGSVTINGVPIVPGPGLSCPGCSVNRVVKYNGSALINSNITDTGTTITAAAGSSQLALTTTTADLIGQNGANYAEVFANSGGTISLTVGNALGDFTGLSISATQTKIGDSLTTKNGTVITVNDFAETISLNADNGIGFLDKLVFYNNVAPVDGQVLIGGTAAGNWTAGTISGTSPIVVTNGNNTIAVSCPTCGTGTGTVTGTGTTNAFTYWSNGPSGVLADAPLTKSGNNSIFTGEVTAPSTLRTGVSGNTDLAGRLTVGAGGTITYTFTQTYASAPKCVSSDEDATPLITGASASTTVLTVTGTVGHVVTYICVGGN